MLNRLIKSEFPAVVVKGATKRGASAPRPLLTPPPRGTQKQHMADAPLAGGDQPVLLLVDARAGSPSWRFRKEAELTFARRRVVSLGRSRPWFFLLRLRKTPAQLPEQETSLC